MSSIPRVTTVIPTFCRLETLRIAIDSALGQAGVDVRVAVFDNASDDGTREFMEALVASDDRVRYHRHPTNIGAYANFESGIRSVETDFFSILSDDDYLLPDFYARALSDMDMRDDVMFWAGSTLRVDESGSIIDARMEAWEREGVYHGLPGVMAMMHGLAPTWTGILFRRAVVDSIGLPDARALGPTDLDYVLRAAAHFAYIASKHPSAVFRLNMQSFSETQPLAAFWPGWLRMFENFSQLATLSEDARMIGLAALRADGTNMLFRRGANALAKKNLTFAREASFHLLHDGGSKVKGCVLAVATLVVSVIPGSGRLYTWLYRIAEARIVRSRSELQQRFGYLIRGAGNADGPTVSEAA